MKKYIVELTQEERVELNAILRKRVCAAQRRCRVHALLLADSSPQGPGYSDAQIAEILGMGTATVERLRKRFVLGGLEVALERKDQANRIPQRIDGSAEAALIAMACGPAPEGRKRWTLQLLSDRLIALGYVQTVGKETVRRKLKKTM